MKFLLDENLPEVLSDGLQILSTGELYEVHHVIPRFGRGTLDVNWLQAAGKEGGWVVITNDHHIKSRPHEIAAWRQHQITGFVLPKQFNQMTFWTKTAFLLRWWEEIVAAAREAKAGSMFPIPSKWTPSRLTRSTS